MEILKCIKDEDEAIMTYEKERVQLEQLLLNNVGQDILNHAKDFLDIVPELIICAQCEHDNPAHIYNVFEHILHVVAGVEGDLKLKLAALLHDIGKPYVKTWYEGWFRYDGHPEVSVTLSKLILKRLGYSVDFIEEIAQLVKYHDEKIAPEKEGVEEILMKLGKDNFERLLALQQSDILAHEATYAKRILEKLNEVRRVYQCMESKGDDNCL